MLQVTFDYNLLGDKTHHTSSSKKISQQEILEIKTSRRTRLPMQAGSTCAAPAPRHGAPGAGGAGEPESQGAGEAFQERCPSSCLCVSVFCFRSGGSLGWSLSSLLPTPYPVNLHIQRHSYKFSVPRGVAPTLYSWLYCATVMGYKVSKLKTFNNLTRMSPFMPIFLGPTF